MLMSKVKTLGLKVGDKLIMQRNVSTPHSEEVVIDQAIMDYINETAHETEYYLGLIRFVKQHLNVEVPYMTHLFLERKS